MSIITQKNSQSAIFTKKSNGCLKVGKTIGRNVNERGIIEVMEGCSSLPMSL